MVRAERLIDKNNPFEYYKAIYHREGMQVNPGQDMAGAWLEERRNKEEGLFDMRKCKKKKKETRQCCTMSI